MDKGRMEAFSDGVIAIIITIMVLIANLVVEILYGVIDPRVKATQQDS